jgi:hypothetical protein
MRDLSIPGSTAASRRTVLRTFALTAGGAAMLGATASRALSENKVPQKSVGYQDTPKGALQCDNCRQFVGPSSCKVVDGTIAPTGWCSIYLKKPA